MDDKNYIKVDRNFLESCLNCPICHNHLNEATGNTDCIHIFCKKCVEDLITEEGIKSCPICEVDWGRDPRKKMRPDGTIQSLRDTIFPQDKKTVEGTEVVNTPSKTKGLGEEMMSLLSLATTYKSSSPSKDSEEGVEPKGHDSPKSSGSTTLKAIASSSKKQKGKKNKKIKSSQNRELAREGSSQSSQQEQVPDKTNKPLRGESIWITLEASEDQEGVPLSAIDPQPYIKVKDRSMKVSRILQFVQNKLGLESEEEIEITCLEDTLPPTMEIRDVYEAWLDSVSCPGEIYATTYGSSAEDRVMVINYGRKVSKP